MVLCRPSVTSVATSGVNASEPGHQSAVRFIVEIVKARSARPKVSGFRRVDRTLACGRRRALLERIRGVAAAGCAVIYIAPS
jgi:hypothetical protein